ncbi:MAG: class I SAM-dependent methyltransferase [Chloroflexi bacterium]|nr:class I SAM-dependent methyltransferase [Chloroflexota bacterium]
MRVSEPWRRLSSRSFWRLVDAEHNRLIADELNVVERVLDAGCGYGSLTSYLSKHQYLAAGIDPGRQDLARGLEIFGQAVLGRLLVMKAEELAFASNSFDAVVLRDAMHHLYGEGEIALALNEIERALKPGGKLVVFDPQPNLVVRLSRTIVHHWDFECSAAQARRLLEDRGWRIVKSTFTELFALPASGGYVGVCLVPGWPALWAALLRLNRFLSGLLARTPLGPLVLWRYILVAEPPLSHG